MAETDDDEWEYEYDEDETEDFYIPIDLSNVPGPQSLLASETRLGHPVLLRSRLRALNAQRGQTLEVPSVPSELSEGHSGATMGEVQITGLHTSNPLVMHNGQLLSCHWASTIGTDMFFAKPEKSTGESSKPLRSLPAVDLMALGSAKLIAKVGTLRPRDDLFPDSNESQLGSDPTNTGSLPAPSAASKQTEHQSSAETRPPPPGSFLARLNQAKAKRGDSTRIVLSNSGESRLIFEKIPDDEHTEARDSSHSSEDAAMGGMSENFGDTEKVHDTEDVGGTENVSEAEKVDSTNESHH
ncbi:hypothetical protein IQ07DRAFT_257112 [Pyrenochaeta sp. DS3sAY3a]|nr:hypothetical protein IQ07DRAFT_257112 [Pyrenochaeta sp. DS3sAY3a]